MKTTAIYQAKGYRTVGALLQNSDGTASVSVLTAGTDDSTVKGLTITSTDTAARAVEIIAKSGSVEYVVDTLSVPANAGTNGTATGIDGLTAPALPLDRVAKKVLPLAAGAELRIRAQAAVTSGKKISVVAFVEDY